MQQFLYQYFTCGSDDLQAKLSELGAEGWRLHTCEPVLKWGPQGISPLEAFVVMDKVYTEAAPEDETPTFETPTGPIQGIPMKG